MVQKLIDNIFRKNKQTNKQTNKNTKQKQNKTKQKTKQNKTRKAILIPNFTPFVIHWYINTS